MKNKLLIPLSLALLGAATFFWFYQSQENFKRTEEAGDISERGSERGKPPSAQTIGGRDGPPQLGQVREHPDVIPKKDFPDTENGRRLENHMLVMGAMGEDSEEAYQESLAELKKDAEENIQSLSQVYQKMEEGRYADRWKVVNTIAALQDDAGLESLNSIAKQAIPPEKFPGSHGIGSTGEERVIRVTAAEGLAALAKNGNREAEAALLQLAVEKDDLSIRRRAIRGYLAAGDNYEERVEVLRTQVPPGSHALITLEVTSPGDVPQLEPPSDGGAQPDPVSIRYQLRIFLGWISPAIIPSAWAIQCDYEPPSPEEFAAKGVEYVDFPAIYESHYSADAWCSKKTIAKMWNDFKFERKIWDADTGYYEPCNLDFPLGRTFNTLWLIYSADPDPVNEIEKRKLGILGWGYDYVAKVTAHLRLHCDGSGPSGAAAWYVPSDRTMNLLWGGTLGTDILGRASLIIHEAGHYMKLHVPAAGACTRNISCDPNWEYKGANTYEALWLWKFYRYAVNTTSAHKDRAKVLGQDVLDAGFNDPPGYTIY